MSLSKKTLVIVESPAKARTIGRYLGPDYDLAASVGHIRDLPTSTVGIDINNGYRPQYVTMLGKEKVARELIRKSENAERVLIATDPDREGEAIAWHIATLLKIDPEDNVRVTFNEITKKSVTAAVEKPQQIDMDLVNAQQARRVLDRLVGYELSPLLWKKVKRGLSAGRVQSVAVRMVVEREEEIENFVPEEYWLLDLMLSNARVPELLVRYQGELQANDRLKRVRLASKEETDAVIARVKGADLTVNDVRSSTRNRRPWAPFTTSTLQQVASRMLGFSASRTMRVAQQLYEGVNVTGQGSTSLVTYIRTDSRRIAADALNSVREVIQKTFGAEYLPPKPNFFANRKSVQDAHECIRPTHFDLNPEALSNDLNRDQYRLYKLIWDRFMACQMAPAKINSVTIDVECDRALFRAQGENIAFPGFLIVFGKDAEIADEGASKADKEAESAATSGEAEGSNVDIASDSKNEDDDRAGSPLAQTHLPEVAVGDKFRYIKISPEQKFTRPPARYTEASLIKAMEDDGIGRPSTYAPTITTIKDRNYVENEGKNLVPTSLGRVVTNLLRDSFDSFIQVPFTARMEEELDIVEEGKRAWNDVVDEFYRPFHAMVEKAGKTLERVEMPVKKIGRACPECGADLVLRDGRYGEFIACSAYPKCRYSENVPENIPAHCPLCGSGLESRRSKRGYKFYVCDKKGKDPECPFISWDLPINNKFCDTCGSYMVSKRYRRRTYPACSNPDCPTNSRKKKSDKTPDKSKDTTDE
ncbi:MAG: type I DNA topoisomerase [Clostridiaceae bacterium]|nr:type I DNA topoisomerase [Clostridiaceae bacterium]